MVRMTIGQAARRAGVGAETVGFCERQEPVDRPARPGPAGAGAAGC